MKLPLSAPIKNAAAAILLCLIFYIILPFVLVKFFPAAAESLRNFRWTMTLPMLFIGGGLYLYSGDFFISRKDFTELPLLKISLCSIGILVVCGGISILWLKLLELLKINYSKVVPVEDFIRSCSGAELIAAGIFICLLTPLFEEIIFRRVIFDGIKSYFPPVTSAVVCSMLFAALHGILFQLMPLFVLGLYFQALCMNEQKLGASIYAHFFNNTLAFCVLLILK